MKYFSWVGGIFLAAVLMGLGVGWGTAEAAGKKADPPISITADTMVAEDRDGMVTFSGQVVARQEDLILSCDTMQVFYLKDTGPSQSSPSAADQALVGIGGQDTSIDKIVAQGNVKITKGDRVAQAQRAVYLAKTVPRTIVLTGDPRVWRDKDFLTGKKITYYLDEDRSVVEGGGGKRVNAIFYQGSAEAQGSQ